jgi:hypothetical protein
MSAEKFDIFDKQHRSPEESTRFASALRAQLQPIVTPTSHAAPFDDSSERSHLCAEHIHHFDIEFYVRSNTSRTFLARTSSVKGFFRKSTSACKMPQRTIVSSV